jgi:peroxiredoxin family protein
VATPTAPPPDQMAIVLTENAADKLLPFATLAAGAIALGFRVDVFASYWGLVAFRKTSTASPPAVSPGHGEDGARLEQAFKAPRAPSWKAILEMAKTIGELHVYACSQSMELLGLSKDDLDPLVDEVSGVATFIDRTRYAGISYFI